MRSLEYLPSKHEDGNSLSRDRRSSQVWWVYSWNQQCEGGTGGSLHLLVGQFSQIGELKDQWNTLCQKMRWRTPNTRLWSSHTIYIFFTHNNQHPPPMFIETSRMVLYQDLAKLIHIINHSDHLPAGPFLCPWGYLRLGGLCHLKFGGQQRKATLFLLWLPGKPSSWVKSQHCYLRQWQGQA